MHQFFRKFSHWTSEKVGSPWAFTIAFAGIAGWALLGPVFEYSQSWQIFINTCTTILTFLMVFLIQNTQNRDAHAIHLKLDELRKVIDPPRNSLIDIEDMEDEELAQLQEEFKQFRARKLAEIKARRDKK